MIRKNTYFFGLLLLILSFSCKKERKGESIDYTQITEQRIMEISEKAAISSEDIVSLERLVEKVTDNTAKARFTGLVEGVKIIKDMIPGIEQLRTDPEINFQEKYKELDAALKLVSDQLPRKAKLQKELEDAKTNYSTEEYTYPDWVVTQAHLGAFLANNYNIQPVAGKPYSFLRKDIEGIDSLSLFPVIGHDILPYAVIKTFKGLRALNSQSTETDTLDLNYLKNLEYLSISYKKHLRIDSCQKLKYLFINGGYWGETLDFTNKYPLLESLGVSQEIATGLVNVLLPGKPHLRKISFPLNQFQDGLPKMKRLIIEAETLEGFTLGVGDKNNAEVEEVKISGIKKSLWIRGNNADGPYPTIKKLELSNIHTDEFSISAVNLLQQFDFGVLDPQRIMGINTFTINAKYASLNDLLNLDKHYATLQTFGFSEINIPGGTLDLRACKKLTNFTMGTETAVTKENPVRKLIVSRETFNAQGTCDDCFIEAWSSAGEVEIVAAD